MVHIQQPLPRVANSRRQSRKRGHHRWEHLRKEEINEAYLSCLDWDGIVNGLTELETSWGLLHREMLEEANPQTREKDMVLLLMLTAWANAEDNPWWHKAMNEPYTNKYWRAAEVELDTLERKMDSWNIVD